MEFYYMSSNGQIRDSSGELYHAAKKNGWQKDDHKYIKREWKNGKWVYTYKNDVKKPAAATNYVKAKNAVKDGSKIADAVTTYKQEKSKAKNYYDLAEKALTRARSESEQDKRNEGVREHARALGLARFASANADEVAKQITKLSKEKSNAPHVSKEYLEELEYNSKKNDGSVDRSEEPKKQNTTETKKQGSSEYEAEKAYNSQKNEYPSNNSTKTDTKTDDKKTSWLDEAKKKLDNLGDWASDKLSDVGDNIKDAADDVADWVGDRMDDLHDATIGNIKDALGYDERDAMSKAYKNRYNELDGVRDMMYQINESLHDEESTQGRKIEMAKWISDGFIQPRVRRYLEADVEYQKAAEEYYSTPIGKLDAWINGRETTSITPGDARAVQKRFSNDPTIREAETDFIVNELTYMAVREYLDPTNSPWTRRDETEIYDYFKELESSSTELYRKLKRYAHNGTDLRRNDNSNIELDRIDRIVLELEEMFRYDGMGRLK